jgi:hypothetical protein
MVDNLIQKFLTIINQIKFFHWETDSYSVHKALDKFHGDFSDLVDTFVEVLIGKYGRDVLVPCSITLRNLADINIIDAVNQSIEFIQTLESILDSKVDSDLLNIKDEMLAQLNKLKYLLTLK